MVTSVPAWFGSKGRTRKPLGLDVTTITDTSNSMKPYIDFITSADVYIALETAFLAENIGVSSQNENKYSFCVGANNRENRPPTSQIEKDVIINASLTRWALGSQVLADVVTYPTYNLSGSFGENVIGSLNTIETNNREYNVLNQRVTIAGSDSPTYMSGVFPPDPDRPYSSIFVGVHSVIIREDSAVTDPPTPNGTLVGMVYTTDTLGVAIYMEEVPGSPIVIHYRENMPVTGINIVPDARGNRCQACIDRAIATNGAIYNIDFFSDSDKYVALAESLGTVLGKYLYSIS